MTSGNFEPRPYQSLWKLLKKGKKVNRLILLYKGLTSEASIPTDGLNLKPRCGRNQHSMAFQTHIANTDVYKGNFFFQIIRDWNLLLDSLMSSAEDAEDCVSNKHQKWDPLRAMKRFKRRKVGHTTSFHFWSLLWWELGTNFPNHRSWWVIVVSAFLLLLLTPNNQLLIITGRRCRETTRKSYENEKWFSWLNSIHLYEREHDDAIKITKVTTIKNIKYWSY